MKSYKLIGSLILSLFIAGCGDSGNDNDNDGDTDNGGNNTTETGVWSEKTAMPTARSGFLAISVNDKIYVIGGYDRNSRLSLVEEYDPSTQTWTNCGIPAPGNACALMLTARSNFGATVVNGEIYILGGRSAPATWLDTLEAYDPVNNIWSSKYDMPTARDGVETITIGTSIYAIGGAYLSAVNSIEVYDTINDSWSVKSPIPDAHLTTDFSTSYMNEKIYLTGGYDASINYVRKVVEYNPTTETWTPKASMLSARSSHTSVILSNKLYVFGGEDSYCNSITSVEVYDAASNNWSSETEIPYTVPGCTDLSASTSNGKSYIVWGSMFGTSKFYEFTP